MATKTKEKKKSADCMKCKQSISRVCYPHLISEFPHRMIEFGWMVSTSAINKMEGKKLVTMQDFLTHPMAWSYKTVTGSDGEPRKKMLKMWVRVLPFDVMVGGIDSAPCAGTDVCYKEVNRGFMCSKHQKIIDDILRPSTEIE